MADIDSTNSIVSTIASDSPFVRVVQQFAANRIAVAAAITLAAVVCIAIFAPLISPQNPYDLGEIDLQDGRLPPASPKFSKLAQLGLRLSASDLGSAPALQVRPMGRGGDVPPDSLTVTLEPAPGEANLFGSP